MAEGQPWVPHSTQGDKPLEELYKEGIFPDLRGRDTKFPEGECLNDVARRAEEAIRECILPHLFDESQAGAHIGLTSHGICLSETISALLRLDPETDRVTSYKGHYNTAWSRLEISLKVLSFSYIVRVSLFFFCREDIKATMILTHHLHFKCACSLSITMTTSLHWCVSDPLSANPSHRSLQPPPSSENEEARAFFSGTKTSPEVAVAASQ